MIMNSILRTLPIEDLKLSIDSFNFLKWNRINTIGDLLDLNLQKLISMKNIEQSSIKELLDVIQSLISKDIDILNENKEINISKVQKKMVLHYIDERTVLENVSDVIFIDQKGLYVDDIPVTEIGFSNRTMIALIKANYNSTLKVINMNYDTLKNIKGMGTKALDEIIEKLSKIVLIHFESDKENIVQERILDFLLEDLEQNCKNMNKLQMLSAYRSILFNIYEEIYCETMDDLINNQWLLQRLYTNNIVEKMLEEYILMLIEYQYVSYSYLKNNMPKIYIYKTR